MIILGELQGTEIFPSKTLVTHLVHFIWTEKGKKIHRAASYLSFMSNSVCRRMIQASGKRSGHVNKV